MRGSSSQPFLHHRSLVLSATAPDLGRGVTPLGHRPSGMESSRLLPLTSDVGWLLSAALWRARRSRLHYGVQYMDCKEIQPVHSEGDQPWDFFGRNDAKAETSTLATSCEELTHWKRL